MLAFRRLLRVTTAWLHPEKKTTAFRERDEKQREAFLATIAGIVPEKLAYVDETGIETFRHRPCAGSPAGVAVPGWVSGRKFEHTGMVACRQIVAPMRYAGTMDAHLFEAWFGRLLLPRLGKGHVVVMDNATFHRKARLRAMAAEHGCAVLFLPPYSPDLNPVEKFWARRKAKLRKIMCRCQSLASAVNKASQEIVCG
ncbi:MAG: transposase [Kiritimatiellaeota bacterium]|nr:transposase [Kiritimatiellota bacterium]